MHGSALNRSNRQRRLLLHEYAAADAWPLMGVADFDEFNDRDGAGRAERRAAHRAGAGSPAAAAGRPSGLDLREPARTYRRFFETFASAPMPARLARRALLFGAGSALLGRVGRRGGRRSSMIGGEHGTIDFAIGDSRLFRTTGSFTDWQGSVTVDDADVRKSTVEVVVNT